jgi:RHS repeat-associated protein
MQPDLTNTGGGFQRGGSNSSAVPSSQSPLPTINLPKGGGALRGIDEKFAVNPVNGTCDLSIPLPFSKTRSDLDGGMALGYSSGAGHGPFGLGWTLNQPSIQRRTDKHLPRYQDSSESDVFLLAGAEDLVPASIKNASGKWAPDVVVSGTARAERYRPRVESAFARIEKITVQGEIGFFWKVTSRDNVVTIFGRTAASRIADPDAPERTFRWLPTWIYDDKGNCVEFVYKNEDLAGVPDQVQERNRLTGLTRITNKYLKWIRSGNQTPYYPPAAAALNPPPPANPGYFFETIFDYGEHDDAAATPIEARTWPCRYDPSSDFRAGFEVRTYRLCRRILFFHSFTELNLPGPPGPQVPCLVRSLDLAYKQFQFDGSPYRSEEADLLTSVKRTHYRRISPTQYKRQSLPALEFSYHGVAWSRTVQTALPEDVVNAPTGGGAGYQWIDMDGFGLPGLLSEQATGWYYKSNLGDGHFSRGALIAPKPSFTGIGSRALQIQDLDADGSKQIVSWAPGLEGYFERTDDDEWKPFRAFEQRAVVDSADPNIRLLDLDGDGRADLLLSEETAFRWYPSLGRKGFDEPQLAAKSFDEESGPAIVFADETQSIFLADMNGDGLVDIVRAKQGELCYFPNIGRGRFGAKVSMRDAPIFDLPERFDPARIQFADVSGTGAADLIYLGPDGFTAWLNLAGNAWSAPQTISPFPGMELSNRVAVLDLLGNGTAALVWSSELPANAGAPIRYVDLMGGKKPYILSGYKNNLGMETSLEYTSSSRYAIEDRAAGLPWATKLPFPTMCLSRSEIRERVSGTVCVHEYRYRHGYYDHEEREFRGFGMVEETDTDSFERFAATGASNVTDISLHQPSTRTRSWYHTGAFTNAASMMGQFRTDYFQNPVQPEYGLPDDPFEGARPTPEEMRQAARACKGVLLRQEIYADDESLDAPMPFSTAENNCRIRMLQPMGASRYAVFLVHESEAITCHYERDPADPRVTHQLNTVIDELGNVVESASVAYGRRIVDPTLPAEVQAEQSRVRIVYTVNTPTNDVITIAAYRLRQRAETQSFEVTGLAPASRCFTLDEMVAGFAGATPIPFESSSHPPALEKRRCHHQRTLFGSDADPNLPLPLFALGSLGLHYDDYRLALDPSLRQTVYGTRLADVMLQEGGYLDGDSQVTRGLFPKSDPAQQWWVPSGTVRFPPNPDQHFYQPDRHVDPFGAATRVRYYGAYHLLIDRVDDPLGNQTTATNIDWRFLMPQTIEDINGNLTEVTFDVVGAVVATAVRGKGAEADDLVGFDSELSQAAIDAFLKNPAAKGPALLQHATSRVVYDYSHLPAVAATITRETHHQVALAKGVLSKLQYAFEYSDGLGHVAMRKVQAEPGKANRCDVNLDGTFTITEIDTTPNRRWVGTGRTVLNNKGNRVMAYEPYFAVTPAYEDARALVEAGVTPVLHYDPLDRVVRTDLPDESFTTVCLGVWQQRTSDENDNLKPSGWYAARINTALGADEQAAAQQSELHDATPSVAHTDSLGRTILTVEHNRWRDRQTKAARENLDQTLRTLDINGKPLAIRDPRGNVVMRYGYDLAGATVHTVSMDAGERWMLADVHGKPLYTWDAQGPQFHITYDLLRRPTTRENLALGPAPVILERTTYGINKATNQNGRMVTQRDGSGVVEITRYDFNGNVVVASRRFATDAVGVIDWTNPPAVGLEPDTWTTRTAYDALNRVVTTTTPDGSVTTPSYSEASLLSTVIVSVRGAPPKPFITRIEHDAKGQRTLVEYGNGVATRFTYDVQTFRVRSIVTKAKKGGVVFQDLAYTYDPVGNITLIRDFAQQDIYFNNQIAQPANAFEYDALYRLVSATGREHAGQNAPVSELDQFRTGLAHQADAAKMQNYRQEYEYDAAGNLTVMAHNAGAGSFTNKWTRQFTPVATSNRLATSDVGSASLAYDYDAHGNLNALPWIATLGWDVEDRFRHADLGGGGNAHYTYDASGNRARKVLVRIGGPDDERLYLGPLEVFRSSRAGGVTLERQTLHVMDGERRLAIVDSRVVGNDGTPATLVRYQYANHLGTAALELDDQAQVISYEEYYPYGSTSLQTVDQSRPLPAKRYRYTSKERDEGTGFYYHGARYYAAWLGRWTAPDKVGSTDGLNPYVYCRNSPIGRSDPTGCWSYDQHFILVYWTGRLGGANHEESLLVALASQSADDIGALVAPRQVALGSLRHDDVQIRRARNLHALGIPYSQAASYATKAIQRGDLLGLGLAFHTLGDWRPHLNTSNLHTRSGTGLFTVGHQEGVAESGSASHWWSTVADRVPENPNKALDTIGNFLWVWTQRTGQPFRIDQDSRRLIEQLVGDPSKGATERSFSRSGLDPGDIATVLRLARSPKERLREVLTHAWAAVAKGDIEAYVSNPWASAAVRVYEETVNDKARTNTTQSLESAPHFWRTLGGSYQNAKSADWNFANPFEDYFPNFESGDRRLFP